MHLLHEISSPQAFEGLRSAGRAVRRPDLCVATADHDVPTTNTHLPLTDRLAATQLLLQQENCREFGVELHPMGSAGQGIVHVIGPEMGLTQPGMTIVCGDSHTAAHVIRLSPTSIVRTFSIRDMTGGHGRTGLPGASRPSSTARSSTAWRSGCGLPWSRWETRSLCMRT
jgi:hypothetical protein